MPFFKFFFQMSWKITIEIFCIGLIFSPVLYHKELQKFAGEFGTIAIISIIMLLGILFSCTTAESISKIWRQRHKKSYLDIML